MINRLSRTIRRIALQVKKTVHYCCHFSLNVNKIDWVRVSLSTSQTQHSAIWRFSDNSYDFICARFFLLEIFFFSSFYQTNKATVVQPYTHTHTCTHDIVGALINMFNSSLNSRVFFCLHLSLLQWNWKLQMNDRDGMNWVKIAICAPLPMQTIDFYANHSHTRNTNIFKILVWFGWTFFLSFVEIEVPMLQ